MTSVLFIFVNLVFFCPKMILCIKIEISRNDFYNSLGFYFHNKEDKFHAAFKNTETKIFNKRGSSAEAALQNEQ